MSPLPRHPGGRPGGSLGGSSRSLLFIWGLRKPLAGSGSGGAGSQGGPDGMFKSLEAGQDAVCSGTPWHSCEQGPAQWRAGAGEDMVCSRLERSPARLEEGVRE